MIEIRDHANLDAETARQGAKNRAILRRGDATRGEMQTI